MTTSGVSRIDGESWLASDHDLLNDASGFAARVQRDDLQIGSRPMTDDPNLLFRWRLPAVNAPADVVFEGFVHRLLDYHGEWTREFAGGHVVDTPTTDTRIVYQRFKPGIPGISPRDLCSAEVVRDLPGGAKLASFRSVDAVPRERGYVRITWWALRSARPSTTAPASSSTSIARTRAADSLRG